MVEAAEAAVLATEHVDCALRVARGMVKRGGASWFRIRDEIDSFALEGLVVLARRWDESRGVPFGPYLSLHLGWFITSSLRTETGWRRSAGGFMPGTSTPLSLDAELQASANADFGDMILDDDVNHDPERVVVSRVHLEEVQKFVDGLSSIAREEIRAMASGRTMTDIAHERGISVPAVSSVAKRARQKLARTKEIRCP